MKLCLVLLGLVLLSGSCIAGGPDRPSLRLVDGAVERFADGLWSPTAAIGDGDRIRTVGGSRLVAGDTDVWLLPETEAVVDGAVLALERGDAAVEGTGVKLQFGDTLVSGTGAFRVAAGVTPRAAVYTGRIDVQRPGETSTVDALRQMDLSSRRLNSHDAPLAYNAEDAVDQRYLGRAIAFDAEVARLTTRLDEVYGIGIRPSSFYESFADLPPEDLAELLAIAPNADDRGGVGPAAEALMGVFVGRAVVGDDMGELPVVADQIAHLRAEGARWGLVATTMQLNGVAFGATVDQAFGIRAGATLLDTLPDTADS